jgi:hypothetical protein
MEQSNPPALVRLSEGLGPLPEPTHMEFREPRERYTAAQMRAYATQEVARVHDEWAAYLLGKADKHTEGAQSTYDADARKHYEAVAALLRVLAKQGLGPNGAMSGDQRHAQT